jgi:hypothetical protein
MSTPPDLETLREEAERAVRRWHELRESHRELTDRLHVADNVRCDALTRYYIALADSLARAAGLNSARREPE